MRWFYVLLLVLTLSACGAEQSQQQASDVTGSQIAQSVEGDAISGQEVRVDKSTHTHIEQQILIQTPVEQAAALEQRRQQGMTAFEWAMVGLGVSLIFIMLSSIILFALYFFLAEAGSRRNFIADLRLGMRRRLYRRTVTRFAAWTTPFLWAGGFLAGV